MNDKREITYLEAIREALQQMMRKDENIFLIGEDIAEYGGAFGVTVGMVEEFGKKRVRNTPISEAAIIGVAGVFLSQVLSTYPLVGHYFLIPAFVVVVLGGFGSILGALVASVIIGFLWAVPPMFIGIGWGELIVFSVFIAILVFRPSGLFGKIGI